jgi:hypothetical protein
MECRSLADPSDDAALLAILARPDSIRIYPPPGPGGMWKATLIEAIKAIGEPVRPYILVGHGATKDAAIDHLLALEAADTWRAENG